MESFTRGNSKTINFMEKELSHGQMDESMKEIGLKVNLLVQVIKCIRMEAKSKEFGKKANLFQMRTS